MPLDHHHNSQPGEVFNRELRSSFRPTQTTDPVHHVNRKGTGNELCLYTHRISSRDHTSHPSEHSVPVHRARRPLVSGSLEECGGSCGERFGTEESSKNSFRIFQRILRRL